MNKAIVILISIILLLLVFVTYGISRMSNDPQDPIDGASEEGSIIDLNAYVDKGVLNPWPHNDPDPNSVALPSASQLMNIYDQIRKAYDARDYDLFKKYASSQTIWSMEHNLEQEEDLYESQHILSLVPGDGVYNFTNNALLLPLIEAPEFKNIEAVNVTWDEQDTTLTSFMMIDKEKMEKYRIEGQAWNVRANLNVNIIDNGYQKGSGIVHYVYDDGEFKYHFEEWTNEFSTDMDLGDKPTADEVVFTLDSNEGRYTPEIIFLQKGHYVKWPSMNGFILSQNESPVHFASPFLKESSYTKKFDTEGIYEYVIFDHYYNELFRGQINVE